MINTIFENNNGKPIDLTEYQGDSLLMLVFFRGVWCNHCKKQLKDIENNLQTFQDLNTKIVAISNDTKFNSSILKTFLGLSFPVISDADFKLIDELGLKTIYKDKEISKPAIFIFRPDQTIAYQYIGEEYDDRLSANTIISEIKKIQ